MSFALEFYSLSWDALKAALLQRKPGFLQAIESHQWSTLLDDTDLGQPSHHLLPYPHDVASPFADAAGPDIVDGLDEIAEAMAQTLSPNRDPPEISDNAALVFAAAVRQLGKPLGKIAHDGSVVRDEDGAFPIDFRTLFLNGVAGACFKDYSLGENLAARPFFGLFHLDFLGWGGLTLGEIEEHLANYALPGTEQRDPEWQAIAGLAEGWSNQLVHALRNAASAKSDLVTLYLTVQEHYGSVWEEITEEIPSRFRAKG
jgi:hypothetical protein